jgi:hypothetical protein
MPAHILLERAHVRFPVEGEPFAVRWSMVNAGDGDALVTAWCVYVVASDIAEARADTLPHAPGRVSFSEGRLRLLPGEVFQRQDTGGAVAWRECPEPGRALYFVASVEYTDDTRASRRTHYVQALRPGDPHVHQCHFASLST